MSLLNKHQHCPKHFTNIRSLNSPPLGTTIIPVLQIKKKKKKKELRCVCLSKLAKTSHRAGDMARAQPKQ